MKIVLQSATDCTSDRSAAFRPLHLPLLADAGTWSTRSLGRTLKRPEGRAPVVLRGDAAFTMVEIAIAVAVIAFALVAIIGVLPAGLQVQKENREDTLMAQDGVYWMDAIRSGAEGLNDLPLYVMGIETNGVPATYQTGADIIGLLSMPGTNRAIVRAISGTVSELGPATTEVAFKYLLEVQMLPFEAPPTRTPEEQRALSIHLHELRLSFRWPVMRIPQGGGPSAATLGNGRQNLRTIASGEFLIMTNQTAAYYYLRP